MNFFQTTVLLVIFLLLSVDTACGVDPQNRLSKKEKSVGFELLFNGENLEGWKQNGNWEVVNGTISRSAGGGSLTYTAKKIPNDFELHFQWKVARGSNSGVYYRPGQYEYQILDNVVHVDGKNPRTSAASLYFCMAPSRDVTRPVGQWNDGRVVCKGTVIQHWLNGVKVIDFNYTDPQWKFNVHLIRQRGANLADRGAHLFFQDHGDPVWYRNVKLRKIPKASSIHHQTVQPAPLSEEVRQAEQEKINRILKARKENDS